MKKPQKTLILLALFTILTLISIITVYAVHQTPTEKTVTNTLCTYKSTADYDYTAILKPNIIYNNKTTLKPNEGTIYKALTKQINISLTYTFDASLPAETTITYRLTETLKTAAWHHQITATTTNVTNQTTVQITVPPFNRTELEAIKRKIESETGTSSSTYTLEVTPTFTVKANTTAGQIYQVFTPTLTVSTQRTEEGEVITVEGLHQTKTGAITENQTTTLYEIINQRYASYILTTVSAAGLAFSTYFHMKFKPPTKKPQIKKIIAPHKDMIIEAEETPGKTRITIEVKTIEDLAKTAEILARPILHATKGNEHIFYIIDNETRYQLKITAS